MPEHRKRGERITSSYSETFLDPECACACSFAESVARGHSILTIEELASGEEVKQLRHEVLGVAARGRGVVLARADHLADRRHVCGTRLVTSDPRATRKITREPEVRRGVFEAVVV